ncbi:AraC family transcriptional regulator [Gorillibacterium sp. sgz5001074]|uniref:AraC family transcriptional regulator n=1 Tax=Gorillibacterium sp. sgz5001074 TaxID=3446695 RepID=UPI003F6666F8
MGNHSQPLPGDDHEYSLAVDHLPDLRMTLHVFALHRRQVHRDWAYPEHEHPMFELNMAVEGLQRFVVNGEAVVMEPGDVVLLKPEEKHSCRVEDGREMTYICVHFDVDEPLLRQALCSIRESFHQAGSPLAEAVRPILERIGSERIGSERIGSERIGAPAPPAPKLQALSLTFGLFGALTALMAHPPEGLLGGAAGHGGGAARLAEQLAERLDKSVRDMRSLPDDDGSLAAVSVERTAKELGYSPAYCNRVFKMVFGMSPRRYLSMQKLREAKLLLVNRRLTVEQVAERLGYKDVSQFSKQFKRWMSISPSQYRQML